MEIKNTYKSRIYERKIAEDIFYASIDNTTTQTDTLFKNINERFIQFYFCLKGKITFHFQENYSKVLEENRSFLIFHPNGNLPLQVSVSARSKLNLLVLSVSEMHQLFHYGLMSDSLFDYKQQVYENHAVSHEMKYVFSQIENSANLHNFEDLYFRNKITEMLLLYFSSRQELENTCPYLNTEEDAVKIIKAKDLLVKNISKNMKIKELANEVALSEYKLKDGFKKLYGMNISGYILQHKLQFAKEQIERKNKKIKDIAGELGYENTSHFIDAFKKKYGLTPKQYEKSMA